MAQSPILLQLPIKSGKQSAYDELVHTTGAYDSRTIYICEDSGNLYFGAKQLCVNSPNQLVTDVLFDASKNLITINYNDNRSKYIDLSAYAEIPTAVLGTF